jgi:hypothetical protein
MVSQRTDGFSTWSQLIAKHGIATVIAAVLIGWLIFRIDTPVSGTAMTVKDLNTAHASHVKAADESQRILESLMRQICVNTAKSDEQIRACVR